MDVLVVTPRVARVLGLVLNPPVGLSRAPLLWAHPFAPLVFLLQRERGGKWGIQPVLCGDGGVKVTAESVGDPDGQNPLPHPCWHRGCWGQGE